MQPRGTLREDGAHATLTFRRTYAHLIEHVWAALSTPEGLREWLVCSVARIDGRVGGTIELVSGPAQYHFACANSGLLRTVAPRPSLSRSTGRILAWQPPTLLEYEWNVAPVPEMPQGERAIFRFELTKIGQSTELLVTYRRLTRQTASGFLPGVHAFLDRLEAQLDGRPLVDWVQRFGELAPTYPEWSGHAAHAGL